MSAQLQDRKSVGIFFQRYAEHEWRCIRAIRQRQHPQWSRYVSDFRTDEAA